ncbi:hypothetical protein GC177_04450 [bacterium]|nr:hypothetical protein [bacterium]
MNKDELLACIRDSENAFVHRYETVMREKLGQAANANEALRWMYYLASMESHTMLMAAEKLEQLGNARSDETLRKLMLDNSAAIDESVENAIEKRAADGMLYLHNPARAALEVLGAFEYGIIFDEAKRSATQIQQQIRAA